MHRFVLEADPVSLLMDHLKIVEAQKDTILYNLILSSLKNLGRDLEKEGKVNRELTFK